MILLIISSALNLVGALISFILIRNPQNAKVVGCSFGVAAAACGLVAGGMAIFGESEYLSWLSPWKFADFSLLLNPLTGLLLIVINFLGLMAWIYGYAYFNEYKGSKLGAICLFMNLFVFSMNLVVSTDSAFWFLVFFEMMALTSYYLVIVSETEQALHGGFMYFIMAHFGFVLIMIAFFIMYSQTGSWSFSDFRTHDFGPLASSFIFVLAFFGFGCKAGMFPTHTWLPEAHPEAPSNVSALMSGAMVKIGIYGMILVGLDLLQSSGVQLWWGILVLVIGALSSVLGVTYALGVHDVKKLLAYHTVENIGIILLGVGVGFIGVAIDNPVIAGLGLMAGLFHLLNHAMFKGLLFLGAGSILDATGTRNMDILGGLIRTMPITATCFLIGSLAITAVPPLNGFVSEWYVFQSMITAAASTDWWVMLFCGFGVMALALTGALAIVAFVKAFGVTFLGKPHSEAASKSHEVSPAMWVPMAILSCACIVIAICASWIVPVFESIADSLGANAVPMAENVIVFNGDMSTAMSLPLLFILLIAGIFIAWAIRRACTRSGVAENREVWQTGYEPDLSMTLEAFSVTEEVNVFLGFIFVARDKILSLVGVWNRCFHSIVAFFDKAQNVGDIVFTHPFMRFVEWFSGVISKVEIGNYRWYVLYIVIGFVLFLILACVL
ncbi:MAG: hydrogenase 4 subunit B [Eggerthellaceae bacterium]|nr:hydrogenase 4 subunit B [Eggerthellaceae bacterium]